MEFSKCITKCCQGCIFKQHITHWNIFLNSFIVFLMHRFFQQNLQAAHYFLFTYISTGHTHFSNDVIRISCEPDRLNLVFFSCITPLWNPDSSLWQVPTPIFRLGKKPTFEPKLTRVKASCRILLAFISCIQAVFNTQELAHMGQFVQINKDR